MLLKSNREVANRYSTSERGYWICVSPSQPQGNSRSQLIEAYELLARTYPQIPDLVFAGTDGEAEEWSLHRRTVSSAKDKIHFLGLIPAEELPELVAGADACIDASTDDRCGMRLIEAMAFGVPVACSNISSLTDIVGEAAITFDANDPAEIALALRALGTDPQLTADLISRGFRRAEEFMWRACAEAALAELVGSGGTK